MAKKYKTVLQLLTTTYGKTVRYNHLKQSRYFEYKLHTNERLVEYKYHQLEKRKGYKCNKLGRCEAFCALQNFLEH